MGPTERIDKIKYEEAEFTSTREGTETKLYLTGPGEFLVKEIAKHLLSVPVWKAIFSEFIDPYKRMDYGENNLPALRIYNNSFTKNAESWFVDGDIVCDLIFPANIVRAEAEQLPDSITAALLQQFRRPSMFNALLEKVPGLNELGKRFAVDKNLAFEWSEELLVPLTQVSLNFRIDLRQWDLYLEDDNRTKDNPFERTLGDLERIVTTIQALRTEDPDSVETTVTVDQKIKEP